MLSNNPPRIDQDLIEHVRDLLRLAYPCNEQIVLDALACRMDPDGLASLTTHQYVAAWRDSEILRIRVAEVPQLAPMWALARDAGCLEATDDYDALRSLFRRWGVDPGGMAIAGPAWTPAISAIDGYPAKRQADVAYTRSLPVHPAACSMP